MKKTILYVEDMDANYRLIKRLLTAHPNVELERAITMKEAMLLLQTRTYSNVLLDIQLPDHSIQNMISTVASIREIVLPACRILILTSYAFPAEAQFVSKAGIDAYYTKPLVDYKSFVADLIS
jgi:CheY-like chemotaxis protein